MIGATLPAQIPGGPELIIILLIGLLVFGLPLLLLLGGLGLWRANSTKEDRIEELEHRIAELEQGHASSETGDEDTGRDGGANAGRDADAADGRAAGAGAGAGSAAGPETDHMDHDRTDAER